MNDASTRDRTENGAEGTDSLADGTLGGYLRHHNRPPAFEGDDGYPYTVSIEVEKTANLKTPFSGYLVFPRWALSGAGIVGHLETPFLILARSREEAVAELEALTLVEVNTLLHKAILHRQKETE